MMVGVGYETIGMDACRGRVIVWKLVGYKTGDTLSRGSKVPTPGEVAGCAKWKTPHRERDDPP